MDSSHCCIVCTKEASQTCSACHSVHYCSKEHQISHWKEHKVNCSGKTYQFEWDVTIGHHLVARRDLEAGTFILQEHPLVIVGKPPKPEDKEVCIGCHQKLVGRGVNCPSCKWPMCGNKQCWEEGSLHALGECALLKVARERIPTGHLKKWNPIHIHQCIAVLRCLALKEKDPAKWRELISSKRRLSPSKLSTLEKLTLMTIVPLVNKWFLAVAVPEKGIVNIISALTVSTFGLPGFTCVYAVGNLLDHSCMANAEYMLTKSGKLLVRSTVPIAKGSKITLDYSEKTFYFTKQRLQLLGKITSVGSCHCQRCSDPTELGSYTSGIFCTQCPNQEGILLSENPFNIASNWICNKCSSKKPVLFIANLTTKAGKEMYQLLGGDWRDRLSDCEAYIRKYGKILHPNHYYLTEVKLTLFFYTAMRNTELGNDHVVLEELIQRESDILKLLARADIISPGLSHLRGTLLYYLVKFQLARFIQGFELHSKNMMAPAKITELETLLQTSREARKTFVWGPEEMCIQDPHNVGNEPIRTLEHVEWVARSLKQYQEDMKLFKEQGMIE